MNKIKDSSDLQEILKEKNKLHKHSRIHLAHWFVLISSLILTLGAWYFTKTQVEEKTKERFNNQKKQLIELVTERIEKYEDALWSGVAAIHAQNGETSYTHWKKFSENMKINKKYPGINGIGVIHYLANEAELNQYLEEERKERPSYKVIPPHNKTEFWPITYIEPVLLNKAAVGLDMAHEINRYTAAKKARDTGTAQITGSIILVQDSKKTPGFLFYAPFYKYNEKNKKEDFMGLVYAPFIMKKLMEGVLEKEKRHIGVKISDGKDILYNEHDINHADFDTNPMFKEEVLVEMYGRNWIFDIQTKKSFRKASSNNQPILILIGGIIIDSLLLAIFILLSRSNRKAIEYGQYMTEAYQQQLNDINLMMTKLKKTNKEMESFVYITSHDLRSPLINLQGFTSRISEYIAKINPILNKHLKNLDANEKEIVDTILEEKIPKAVKFIQEAVIRLDNMTSSILVLSRTGRRDLKFETFEMSEIVNRCKNNVSHQLEQSSSKITCDPLPKIVGDKVSIEQILGNIIDNSIKYLEKNRPGKIHISYNDTENYHQFSVSDNGRGIIDKDKDKVFAIFRRAGNVVSDTQGEGMGLNYVKTLVERHGGNMWFESTLGEGTVFFFTIDKNLKAINKEEK